jgi:hypothetical protein
MLDMKKENETPSKNKRNMVIKRNKTFVILIELKNV